MPADPQDLITTTFAAEILAAAGVTPNAGQTAALQDLVTAASQEICRYCRRYFALTSYDEVSAPEPGQADKGEPDAVPLRRFPVQSVARVSAGRTTALTVANTDTTTNQAARVQLTFTGDPEFAATRTGLTLTRTASGVTTTNTLTFAANVTVAALAAAINAVGNGWSASASSSYSLWPSADLYGTLAPQGCLGTPGATLDLFAADVAGAEANLPAGVVYLPPQGNYGQGPGSPWQWPQSQEVPYQGGFRSPVRVAYAAGWVVVPLAAQRACAELVKATLDRLPTDGSLQSENAKDYAYTTRAAWDAIPAHVKQTLALYRVYA